MKQEVADLLPRGTLDRIAHEAGTDKRSEMHDYMRFYEALLSPYRDLEFTLLELGVGKPSTGAPSLRSWAAFFPKARIVGFDITPDNAAHAGGRIEVEIGDASDPATLQRLAERWAPSIIVDDASHRWSHQITAVETLFPLLPPKGVMIVEDIHTSFIPSERGRGFDDHAESFWDYMARLQAALAAGGNRMSDLPEDQSTLAKWIDAIYLSRKTVALIKRSEPAKR